MQFRHKFCSLCLIILACVASGRAAIQVGDKFPLLDPSTLVGGTPPATEGQITLVDFWASWCAPCKMSFPRYAQLYAKYQAQGLVIVAVSADENQSAFDAFVKKESPPFATLRDKTHKLVSQVKVPAMPTCYLLSRDGRVRFIHQGFHGTTTEEDIRREIESLLAEPSPPS